MGTGCVLLTGGVEVLIYTSIWYERAPTITHGIRSSRRFVLQV